MEIDHGHHYHYQSVVIPYQVRSYQTVELVLNWTSSRQRVVIPYQVRSYQTLSPYRKAQTAGLGRNPLSSQVISNGYSQGR